MNREEQKRFIDPRIETFGFTEIFIVDNYGKSWYFREKVERSQGGEYFFGLINSHDEYVTEPFYTGYGPVTTICKAIYDVKGRRCGTICGTVSLQVIQEMIENNEKLLGGQCFIINYDGYYLSSSNFENVYKRVSIYDNKDDVKLITDSFENCRDNQGCITLGGISYLAHIDYMEEYYWAIVSAVPEGNVTAIYSRIKKLQIVLLFLIFILLLSVTYIVLSWRRSDNKINTDSLCGCGSRAACISYLEELQNKTGHSIHIIFSDLNKFKYVNDTFGHEKGDELLKIFSDALEEVFGPYGFTGRMGGDEFIAVLLDSDEVFINGRLIVLSEILETNSRKIDENYVITSSFGIAFREKGSSQNLDEVMQKADTEMYKNKEAHGNAR